MLQKQADGQITGGYVNESKKRLRRAKLRVASMNVNVNGAVSWTAISDVIGLDAAIKLADQQPVRTSVTGIASAEVIYDNGKPHGGKPDFRPRCCCPLCRA